MADRIVLPTHILNLMTLLEEAGEEVYLVGGSLRDALLGIPPHDFDLATSALPEHTVRIFADYRVIETGLKHGTLTVIAEGEPVEITTFRIDGSYHDGRHPDGVTFTDKITEDLSRRDFTVNAMAYHPRKGLCDPFGGREDLERGILRAVREPSLRFSEDALRIMRAFRFSAQLGFSIEPATLLGIAETREGLARIAAERIASEFLRLLCSPGVEQALRGMIEYGVLPYVTGDYRPSDAILSVIGKSRPEEAERLGLFFAEAEPEEAAKFAHALRLSNKQIAALRAVCRSAGLSVHTEADARRLIADCGVYAPFGVRVSVLLGHSPVEAIGWVEDNRAPCTLADLALGGRELISAGIEPRRVGRTLEYLLKEVLKEPEQNEREALLSLALAYNNRT
ncbi:MAG: hypothetical protein IKA76_06810 [Clostridia bacterium]|nr:hypothetical protein [Clostridia bacterium]